MRKVRPRKTKALQGHVLQYSHGCPGEGSLHLVYLGRIRKLRPQKMWTRQLSFDLPGPREQDQLENTKPTLYAPYQDQVTHNQESSQHVISHLISPHSWGPGERGVLKRKPTATQLPSDTAELTEWRLWAWPAEMLGALPERLGWLISA